LCFFYKQTRKNGSRDESRPTLETPSLLTRIIQSFKTRLKVSLPSSLCDLTLIISSFQPAQNRSQFNKTTRKEP